MSYESPNLNLYSSDGYEATVQNNVATPVGTRGLLSAGSDGTTTRFNLPDSSGRQIVAGAGTAGTPTAGVLSIQGVVGGTAVPISGSITATNPSVSTTGATIPASATFVGGSVSTTAPTYTAGQLSAFSLTTSGALRTDSSSTTQPISGTINQGTPAVLSNAWSTKITDGTNGPVSVKAPSTAAVAADPSFVVGLSPNSPLPTGSNLVGKFTLTSPAANAAGINATISTTGALLTANQFGNYLFTDDFNGSVFDSNLWSLTAANGGTAGVSASVATVSTTTTVGSSTILNGVPTINRLGGSFLAMGVFAKFEATTILTGVTRFFGLGTTTSVAITDAIGFEMNTSGVMTAVIYAGGTKIYNQTITTPVDGNYHTYTFSFRPGTALFYVDAFEVPVASSTLSPNVTNLPTLVFNKVITAPSSAASIYLQSMAIVDAADQNTGISDGIYGFRKATVKAPSTAASATDNPLVVAFHPSSPLPAGTNTIGTVNTVQGADISVSSTITAASSFGQIAVGYLSSTVTAAGTFVSIALNGQSGVEAAIPTGTFSGTGLATEATTDGTNWFTVLGTVPGYPNFSGLFTINTHIRFNSSTWTQFRVRAVFGTTITSSPSVHIVATYSNPGAISDYLATRITDGINTLPTMDAPARKGYQALVDTSNVAIGSLADASNLNGLAIALGATNFPASISNNSTTQLAAGATFTGGIETCYNTQTISVLLTSDQNGLITINQYIDAAGTRLASSWAYIVSANVGFSRSFVANGNFFNCTFKNNGAVATTTLNINIAFGILPSQTNLGNAPISINEINGTVISGVVPAGTLPASLTDGTRTVTIKAASTAAVATDTAIVVAISPNNPITVTSSGVTDKSSMVPGVQSGTPVIGQSSSVGRIIRTNRQGTVVPGYQTLMGFDPIDGSTLSTPMWANANTGFTTTQASGLITLNSAAAVTSGYYSTLITNKNYPIVNQSAIGCSFRAAVAWATNSIQEIGFGVPSGTTAIVSNGAFIRIGSGGSIKIVTSFGGVETVTSLSATLNATSYYLFIVYIEDNGARFVIEDSSGIPIVDTNQAIPLTTPSVGSLSHLPSFARVYTSGTAGTAPTIKISSFQAWQYDVNSNKPWSEQLAGAGRSGFYDPTTGAQLVQLNPTTAPTLSTPTNVGYAYTTLCGNFNLNSTASSENALGVFLYQIPTPYTFYITDIVMHAPFVTTTMGTVTPVIHEWIISGVTSTSPSTGTLGGQHFVIGHFTAPAAAAVGTLFTGSPISINFKTPLVIQSSSLSTSGIGILVKALSGTATGAYRGSIIVNGYFE